MREQGKIYNMLNITYNIIDLKNIDLDARIIISCLSSKVMVRDIFLHNGDNVMYSHTTHVQTLKIFFNSLKGPHPSYLVLKFGNIFPVNN